MKAGDVISRYRIIARIGKGGMGEVYRAEDTRLERQVALKFLPQEGFTEQSKSRFLNEARAAAKARHPNICPIHDIEEVDGELFLVMAYIDGETLQKKIARAPLDPLQAAEIAMQIASGLECAHRLEIVHRDIKSANIIVDPNGHASILDFGLALAPASLRVTGAGLTVGTPAYMSPEQIEGREVDARSDIWSLGVVMFEMLTGELPFRRDHASAVVHAVIHDATPSISALRPGVPAELQRIVEKALQKDVKKRWQSASEMEAALKRLTGSGVLSSPEAIATETIAIPSTSIVRPRSARTAAIIGTALLVIAAAGFGIYRFRGANLRPAPPGASGVSQKAAISQKRVAVLPFEVSGAENAAVADAMGEILASTLASLDRSQLAAIGPNDLRSRHVSTVKEANQIYGANLVIKGTVKPSDDKTGFTLNLIDAVTNQPVATRTFLYDAKNPLVSRDQAIEQVVQMLNLQVPASVRSSVTAADSSAPNAYAAYIEGRGFLARYDLPGNVDRAIASFTTATSQDQNYALAYAGLAEAYWRKARTSGDKIALVSADQNADHAVTLDGSLAIAHTVLGYVYLDEGRQQDAVKELQTAMNLAPDNAEAPRKLAEIYKTEGRFDEAEGLYIKSTKSRPTDWYGFLLLGIFYYDRERYDEAIAAMNQAKALTPDNDVIRQDLAAFYRMEGRYQDAIAEYQQALSLRSSASTYAGLGGAYYYEHRFADAVQAEEAAIDLNSDDYRYWGNLGIYSHWAHGSETKSASALRRALELASKFAETSKSNYAVHANIAEYKARLGDSKGALKEIDTIPKTERRPLTTRLAIVYELTGHRDLAIAVIRENLKTAASLNQIKDDPDLAALWLATGH